MDTKKWEVLQTAASLGSLSRAAEKLGYTHSGIAYVIDALEAEVGFPLLLRRWDGVRLTKEAEALLPGIRALTESAETLKELIAVQGGLSRSTFTIGTCPSVAVQWLPPVLAAFRRENRNCEVALKISGSNDDLYRWLEDGEVSFCLSERIGVAGSEWKFLYKDPLLAVLPRGFPCAEKSFTLSPNLPLPYIASPCSPGWTLELPPGLLLAPPCETVDDSVLINMVARGAGFTLLPEMSLVWRAESVCLVPLAPPAYRILGTTRGANCPPAARKFIALLKSRFPRPGESGEPKKQES